MLKPEILNVQAPEFKHMYNRIHVNEKWFYISKAVVTYYLVEDEEKPFRTCKSKLFLTKNLNSKNRAAGSNEMKMIPNVIREEYKNMIIGKLLPGIQKKLPRSASSKTI